MPYIPAIPTYYSQLQAGQQPGQGFAQQIAQFQQAHPFQGAQQPIQNYQTQPQPGADGRTPSQILTELTRERLQQSLGSQPGSMGYYNIPTEVNWSQYFPGSYQLPGGRWIIPGQQTPMGHETDIPKDLYNQVSSAISQGYRPPPGLTSYQGGQFRNELNAQGYDTPPGNAQGQYSRNYSTSSQPFNPYPYGGGPGPSNLQNALGLQGWWNQPPPESAGGGVLGNRWFSGNQTVPGTGGPGTPPTGPGVPPRPTPGSVNPKMGVGDKPGVQPPFKPIPWLAPNSVTSPVNINTGGPRAPATVPDTINNMFTGSGSGKKNQYWGDITNQVWNI